MIKHLSNTNQNFRDIPQFDELRKNKFEFSKNKNDLQAKQEYFQSVIDFFLWYITYCNSNIKKNYSDDNIAQTIFLINLKNQNHWSEFLCKSIFVSKDYVEYLKTKVTLNNISKYDHTISSLIIDLEWLIAQYEFHIKKFTSEISLKTGRRKDLNPKEIYFASSELFFIEERSNVEGLYLRDLNPVVMFKIRQAIEIFGKNLLGYYSLELNNQPIKKFTQIAWKFIKSEIKKTNSRINLPFNIDTIIHLNSWSNDYVHTTYLHSSYIQYFALKILGTLFKSKTNGIVIYNGNNIIKFDIADITITSYNSLKIDFQDYLSNMMDGVTVNWMPIDSVGAYIITE